MSLPRGYDPKNPPGKPAGEARPGRKGKWAGPASTLTYAIQTELVASLRKGATKRIAAGLAGTTEGRLQNWLRRGREAIEAGKRSRYTEFVQEVEKAEASYQMTLVEASTDAITDKDINDKVIRWRLAVAAPKDFTVPREAAAPAGNGHGPLFEFITPDEARSKLDEKLTRFLEEHDQEAKALAEPPLEADEGDEDEGDGR
ncbi:hypothetical protein D7X74_07585 [Corallococcus sp. CA047B]|uniref:hypothetical protein n=1 Tax=Corallococcus sp. CA047B TaxID=2316729 RepID=UPI000EA39484|nr:hypothetical protein [Corallococcus sp. CA047B]RKH19143.1 hypothetical protein D7X74_07585 [Corallococcus sp. CA047B]